MALKEDGASSETVSIAVVSLRADYRRLYMFVWPVVYRMFSQPHEPLLPKFTNHLVTTNFWQTFPSVAVAIPFLFVCGFMTVYFFGAKRLLHLCLPIRWIFSG